MKRTIFSDSWLDECNLPENLCDHESFQKIWNMHPEEQGKILMYGKLIPIPRWQRSYGKDYKFSGVVSKGYPITEELLPYLNFVNKLGYGEFNEILLNWYENGDNYIGPHSDDESQLIPGSPIVTV
ncbi:unnamed protein product, partial [marine sediment metagenome]